MAYYQEHFTLTAAETDLYWRMKVSSILRRLQDIAGHHIDSLGMTRDILIARGQVFLLSKVEVTIHRSPRVNEKVILKTRPHPAKGVYFIRESLLCSEEGETLVSAASAWILADPENHSVLRPNAFDWGAYRFDEVDFDPSVARRRIKAPEQMTQLGQRIIRFTDLDGNGHVNNAVYGDILCDFLPAEQMLARPIRSFATHYEHEAKLGETLSITGTHCEDGSYILLGQRDGERCFSAQVTFDE